MSDTINLTKKNIIIILVVAVIIVIGLVYYFSILPANQKKTAIQEYKKSLYESILCQYQCPIQNYTIDNQTQSIQQRECVVGCINTLQSKGYIRDQFSNNEINSDNLAKDIELVVTNCRTLGVNQETGTQDTEAITECAIQGLEALKETYPYLK